ncbi:MAG TPA: hypothetical protein VFU86_23160 [Terriglobales bacterium]|nr:hypothetical protein [Terriglobales bacterium]
MMLAYRLVRLIELHSEGLAKSLRRKMEVCHRCPSYKNVPEEELTRLVYEMYQHMGEWLLGKTEADIEHRYRAIGARRAQQDVPLSQVIWVIALVKENLWEYLKRENVMERPAEVFGELEMLQLLEQFFDRAQYYAALGYEEARIAHPA